MVVRARAAAVVVSQIGSSSGGERPSRGSITDWMRTRDAHEILPVELVRLAKARETLVLALDDEPRALRGSELKGDKGKEAVDLGIANKAPVVRREVERKE